MAKTTPLSLRNMVMYQIFVRNFSEEGTFAAVRKKLGEIRDLGADIIWLMPIHPVGELKRKGSLGSPYAIKDYRAVNPEFGTIEDFTALVDDIHAHGMKCIIDVVYNHTSPDSVLSVEHPEWFYHKEDGSFGNRVGDWSDIIDLDYSDPALWDYQIETLKMWAGIVDGFRCDVASLIPVDFWIRARAEVEEVRPGCIWLSESVDHSFIRYARARGLTAYSDAEVYQAFDITYDYDIYGEYRDYIAGRNTLSRYAESVIRQECIYPENYVKLRFLENHDQTRAAFLFPDKKVLRNWTAFTFFQKGLALIYAGQEYGVKHTPSLFDKDTVDFDTPEDDRLIGLIKTLADIKRDRVFTDSLYFVTSYDEQYIAATHTAKDGRKAMGLFSLRGGCGYIEVGFEDGVYTNLIDGKKVEVYRGGVAFDGEPIIIIK